MKLLWQTIWRFLKKLKIELPCDPAILLAGISPKEVKVGSQRDICTPLFIAALFIIAKSWKQPKCPLTDKWIKNIWSIHTMEGNSALKMKDILTHATTRMNLENLTLSVRNQSQKDKYRMMLLL